MSQCRDWDQRLTLYAMGELDRAEELRLEEHLDGCPSCRREVEDLRHDLSAIGEAMRSDLRAPAGVVERVEGFVRAHEGPKRRWPRLLWPMLAASWALVAALLFPSSGDSTLNLAAREYGRAGDFLGAPSPAMLAEMSRKTGFEVDTRAPRPGARLVGCWTTRLGGANAAAMAYDYEGKRVVVFQMPEAAARLDPKNEMVMVGKSLFCTQVGERASVAWRAGRRVFVVVSKLDERSLVKLVTPLISST